uniref:Uncharacterized protein n=1 Tax=Panagrolaimus sp. JU765 TaxID=591449 RepID=A0AC34QX94_9BILA
MGGHGDEPLKATYNVERPPWIGLYSDRPYKKQMEWWSEPGLKDTIVRSGRFRANRDNYREQSKAFYDPAVPDGTSLSGPNGMDSRRNPNFTMKGDTAMNLDEWQKKIMQGSLQYKQIMEKYKLSPEHPGLDVNPTMNDGRLQNFQTLGVGGFLNNRWHTFGPRFFDKPLNEGTFEKVACAAKYTAIFMIPYTMFHIRATQCVKVAEFTPRRYFQQYFKLSPFPMAVATSWAFAISAAAAIRNKDDVKNHFIAGPFVGLVVTTLKDNIYLGSLAAGAVTILGLVWQYQRMSETGLLGRTGPSDTSGFHGGPLGWQLLQLGDAEVPKNTV